MCYVRGRDFADAQDTVVNGYGDLLDLAPFALRPPAVLKAGALPAGFVYRLVLRTGSEGNPALRETMGWNARERAIQYNWHAIADRIFTLYRILSEGRIDGTQLLLPFCRSAGGEDPAPAFTCGAC